MDRPRSPGKWDRGLERADAKRVQTVRSSRIYVAGVRQRRSGTRMVPRETVRGWAPGTA